MNRIIPYGKQSIDDDDINAVIDVLKSDFLTQGPKIDEFEKKFAEFVGAKYAVAVNNGTTALHLAGLVSGTRKGSKVITTPVTFAASANSVVYCGGEVDFVDIDPKTYLIDLDKLEQKLEHSKEGEYTGIIPVDLAGYPINAEKLKSIADKYHLKIIEDACHAPGAYFIDSKGEKQYCGNGSYSDLQIFSFHPVKHIAAGEGGMITTNNEEFYKQLCLLRTHGITKDPDLLEENHGNWYYEMQELGFNYRLSDIHAALGLSQLRKITANLDRRQEIAKKYDIAFEGTSILTPFKEETVYHAYHLYIIQTERRKELYDFLRKYNIFTQVHYIPIHLQPYYRRMGWKRGDFPVAEAYYDKELSLPIYHSLSDEEQDFVIEKIFEFLKK